MKNYLILDVETTTHAKGNPYSRRNKLCLVGLKPLGAKEEIITIDYGVEPYGKKVRDIESLLSQKNLTLVGFNIKFDLAWIRRYIPQIQFSEVFDCQLAYFLLNQQKTPYPSLNDVCTAYGFPTKDSSVQQYWQSGVDTSDIPNNILENYLVGDLELTEKVFLKLKEELESKPKLNRLFNLQCRDLLILQEMEQNGLLYDLELSKQKSYHISQEMSRLDNELKMVYPYEFINWNSPLHLSKILYGGSIEYCTKVREEGKKRARKVTGSVVFKRLVRAQSEYESPRTRSISQENLAITNIRRRREGKKPIERQYSTDKKVLQKILQGRISKKATRIINILLERSKLEKLESTYYEGLRVLLEEKDWPEGMIHGNFNQTVASTGRLSSSSPNLQNFAEPVKELIKSRYV